MLKKLLSSLFKPKSNYKSLNWITISQSAITHNFAFFQKLKPNYTIIPVIKSNAYGHGIKQVCQIINNISACKLIAVDSYPEYQIAYKYTDKQILIMGQTRIENYKLFDTKRTHFAVWSKETIEVAGKTNRPIKVHIFINTGMNREGVQMSENKEQKIDKKRDLEELLNTVKQFKNIEIIGAMSHLACADEPTHPLNTIQTKAFHDAVLIIKKYTNNMKYIHIEASSGMINSIDKHEICNAGRLGLGLYGIDPLYSDKKLSAIGKQLRPALDVYSTITCLQRLSKNDSVGYNGTRVSGSDAYLGLFPFGYKEGLDRSLSGKNWKIKIHNCYYKIIGRISMNYATCLLETNSAISKVSIDDLVHIVSSVLSDENNIYNFFDISDKINYEIVRFDDKIKRIVVE